jgi:hypothetical protein
MPNKYRSTIQFALAFGILLAFAAQPAQGVYYNMGMFWRKASVAVGFIFQGKQAISETEPKDHLASDYFSQSVSISGDTLVVGAYYQDYDDVGGSSMTQAGAAYVFTRSGTAWSPQQKLVASGTNGRVSSDHFGQSVSISGDTLVVGAYYQSYDDVGANSLAQAGAAYVFTRTGTAWSQQQKLVATGTNGRVAYNQFGVAVSISADTIVVGANYQAYDAAGANSLNNAGAAFVFTRSGTAWGQQQKLVGTGTNGRGAGDYFGNAVSISVDTLVVGANDQPYDAAGASSLIAAGAAYVFTRSGTAWSQQQKLVGTGTNGRLANDQFGYSVSISVDTVVVGANQQDYNAAGASSLASAGAAYVFTRTGTAWSLQQKLSGTGTNGRLAGDGFGQSVSIEGDTLVVGAPFQSYDAAGATSLAQAGAAYVFTRTGTAWSLQQKLVGTGTNGRMASDDFGGAVSVSLDTVVVGASSQDYDAAGANSANSAGAAYVLTRAGTAWSPQQKLVGTGTNGRLTGEQLGGAVSISGDTLVVGAEYQSYDAAGATSLTSAGAAYVYTRSGTTWSLQQKLVASGTNGRVAYDHLGQSVSISVDTLVVGAYGQSYDAAGATSLASAGAAYVFTRSGTTWSQQQKLVGTGTNGRLANDRFGYAVSISVDTVVVGALQQSYNAAGATSLAIAGAAYVFTRTGTAWSQQQKLVGTGTNGRVANDYFGVSLAISADTVVIGASSQSYDAAGATSLSSTGAAYVFTRTGTAWSQQQKLVGTGTNGRVASDQFGGAVSISVDTIVVGTRYQSYDAAGANSLSNAGAAYVFTRTGTAWSLQQKLVGIGTNGRALSDSFGVSLAISADTVVVGAFTQSYDAAGANSLTNAGAAYVFTRTGTAWSLQQKLVGTGTNGRVASDNFGSDVAVSVDTVAVGAPAQGYDVAGANLAPSEGASYVWKR